MTWTPLLKWFPLSLINLNTYTYVCSCTLPMSMWGLFWSFWDNFFWWMKLHIGEYHLGFYHHRIFEQKRVKTEMVMKLLLDRVNFRTVMTFPCIQCFFLLSISWNLREFNVFFVQRISRVFRRLKDFFLLFRNIFTNLIFRISYKISVNSIILFFSFFVQLISRIFLLSDFFFATTRQKCTLFPSQCGKTRNSLSPKNISSNQLFSNFLSKNVAFTKFLPKIREREFP